MAENSQKALTAYLKKNTNSNCTMWLDISNQCCIICSTTMSIADLTTPIRAQLILDSYRGWIKSNQKVLDIGCGTGIVSDELRNLFKIKITGCDRDKYLRRDIDFKNMLSDYLLPFKTMEFDVAMFNDVLHHTTHENQIKLINESLRVAKKSLIFELKPTLTGNILDFVLNKIHNFRMDIPYTYRNETEWENLFNKNNIRYKKRLVVSPLLYPFSHVAYMLYRELNNKT